MKIWKQEFEPSYVREDGVVVIHDRDIPVPKGFVADPKLRSNVFFPPRTRAGDHYHTEREEVFVGFGEGMELLVESPKTKVVTVYQMDPNNLTHKDSPLRPSTSLRINKGLAFWIPVGMPHAVRNVGNRLGYLIELANRPMEKVPHMISDR